MKNQDITFKNTKKISLSQLRALYNNVGWSAYTESDSILKEIIPNAKEVITAWDKDELIGLIRAVGDGVYILFIQDLLVKESHQGQGIGSELLQQMLKNNEHIRQISLMTTYEEKTIDFYTKNGLYPANSQEVGIAFTKTNRPK